MLHKSTLVKSRSNQQALVLKALGEPRRVEILELLKAGPMAVGEIADKVEVSQQAVSQHLSVLDRAGLVEAHKDGTRSIYAVRSEGFIPVRDFLQNFWQPRLGVLKDAVEKKR